MEDRLKAVMSAVLGLDIADVGADTSAETVEQWDSLKHMDLVFALEDEFGVQFTDDEVVSMVSYKLIREALEGRSACMQERGGC